MRKSLVLLLILMMSWSQAQTAGEALKAAQSLKGAVMRCDGVALMAKTHPRYRERLQNRAGGPEVFNRAVKKATEDAINSGVTIESFVVKAALGAPRLVNFEREMLLILPTSKVLSVVKEKKLIRIEQNSYLVAVAPTGTENWSFIGGESIDLADLRALFPELPFDFKLPEIKSKALEVVDQP